MRSSRLVSSSFLAFLVYSCLLVGLVADLGAAAAASVEPVAAPPREREYVVELLEGGGSEKKSEDALESASSLYTLSDGFGKKYACRQRALPDPALESSAVHPSPSAPATRATESDLPLKREVCARTERKPSKQSEYWNTFEVCLYKNVTQMRILPGELLPVASIHVGDYVAGGWQQTYASSARTATVTLRCDAAKKTPVILSATEPEIGKYHLVLGAAEICDRPGGPTADRAEASGGADGLLGPLKGKCGERTIGWWNFRVCAFASVVQYHGTQTNSADYVEYSLGSFSPEKTLATKAKPLQAAQVFDEGSVCGGKEKRSTRVIYRCSPSAGDFDVEVVEESPLCHYTVRVASRLLCQSEHFRVAVPERVVVECEPLAA